ncbi:uncharacterized protein KIAA2013 homolog [Oscarella lobularis]|uniref:uncharacterized protein KIAA2013 homolog n=1 Tax=Oscarella lobularis TaxID=121494 RepID=UPI00331361A6
MQARLRATIFSLISTRTRRGAFLLLLLIAAIVYYWLLPKNSQIIYQSPAERVVSLSNIQCVSTILERWAADFDANRVDVFVPRLFSSSLLPFVGNGVIGLSAHATGSSSIYLAQSGHLSHNLQISPLVEISIEKNQKMAHGGSVIDFHNGIVNHIYYYSSKSKCVTLIHSIYAHQIDKALLIQKLQFKNKLNVPVTIHLSHPFLHTWPGSTKKQLKFPTNEHESISYDVISGAVDQSTNLVLASVIAPESIQLVNLGEKEIYLPTTVLYNKTKILKLEEQTTNILRAAHVSPNENAHAKAWNTLIHDCISVGSSHDATIPPQKSVLSSLYYALSSIRLDISNPKPPEKNDHSCYEGLPTMHSAALWQSPNTDKSLLKLIENWLQYLTNGGCWNIMKKGPLWIVQAITRSFLAIQTTASHLQVAANPVSLKAAVTLKGIVYESQRIQLSVTMNRKLLPGRIQLISTDGKPPLYACAAGCKDDIQELKTGVSVAFPVIATTPATPILFISANKEHLLKLREQISWEAHEKHDDVIDEEKSENRPLSARFWIMLASLVGLFHICLLRIVYREYFRGQTTMKTLA